MSYVRTINIRPQSLPTVRKAMADMDRAKLLARLIRSDNRMMGYTDIGSRAFGRYGGIGINALSAHNESDLSAADLTVSALSFSH